MHPCRRVQERLNERGIKYRKVIAGHGHPVPILRKGSRDRVLDATGTRKLPTLLLRDGTVLSHTTAIFGWIDAQAR